MHLKRFDFDWERDVPVKFHDYMVCVCGVCMVCVWCMYGVCGVCVWCVCVVCVCGVWCVYECRWAC